jgi:GNAT superfamily N-acetyltransferase
MVIRAARPEERAALEALQRRASLMYADSRDALLANPEAIALPAAHIAHTIVVEGDGVVIGFAVALPISAGHAELDGLFVDPVGWRRGIGRALVAHAGADRTLTVIANPNALGFYTRCGFARTGATTTRFGPAITMTRPPGDQ